MDASGNFSASTITANLTGTASTATTLTGLTSTVAELNFSDGVTSNIQTQLDGKLTSASSLAGNNIVWSTTSTAGKFDTSTTTPTGSTRLNYNGYLYPTYINLSASTDTATTATHYYVETGSDGFVRPKSIANVKAELLASAALTGTTTAPTAAAGTNTTQVATTAFVLANSVQLTEFTQSLATNGYTKLPNGLILQWGSRPIGTGNVSVTFPLTFPTACTAVVVSGNYNGASWADTVTSKSTTGFSGWAQYTASTYIAIGY